MYSYSRNQEVGSMGVSAGIHVYDVVVKKFTFAISSPAVMSSCFLFVLDFITSC